MPRIRPIETSVTQGTETDLLCTETLGQKSEKSEKSEKPQEKSSKLLSFAPSPEKPDAGKRKRTVSFAPSPDAGKRKAARTSTARQSSEEGDEEPVEVSQLRAEKTRPYRNLLQALEAHDAARDAARDGK